VYRSSSWPAAVSFAFFVPCTEDPCSAWQMALLEVACKLSMWFLMCTTALVHCTLLTSDSMSSKSSSFSSLLRVCKTFVLDIPRDPAVSSSVCETVKARRTSSCCRVKGKLYGAGCSWVPLPYSCHATEMCQGGHTSIKKVKQYCFTRKVTHVQAIPGFARLVETSIQPEVYAWKVAQHC
jgi:hypothetical protein